MKNKWKIATLFLLTVGLVVVAVAAINPNLSEWRFVSTQTAPATVLLVNPSSTDVQYQITLNIDDSDCATGTPTQGYVNWIAPDGLAHSSAEIDGCSNGLVIPITLKGGTGQGITYHEIGTVTAPYTIHAGIFGFWG